MRKFRTKHILLITILLLLNSLAQASLLNGCDSNSSSVKKLVSTNIGAYRIAFQKTNRVQFFVGLWQQIKPDERKTLSLALKNSDEKRMLAGLREVTQTVSARLAEDRKKFSTWVQKQGLQHEIEVQEFPADGTFLFFKTNEKGMNQILCATINQELPSYMSNAGF